MKVGLAYLGVVLVWSTTPLAIKWSNSSLSHVAAISSRVVIALVICGLLLWVLRRPLIEKRSDWKAFFAGLLGLFPTMLVVYWAARHIPSGLAAVIFGMYPFMVGFFSLLILKENIFSGRRVVALLFALAGLILVNSEQFNIGGNALYGALGMLSATVVFGFSSVWLKRVGSAVDPLRQSTGVLLLAAPMFVFTWMLTDGKVPETIDDRSLAGVLYLAICGSVLGGTLFFYVLKHCRVASVGLITFITPVMSLLVGVIVDGERLSHITVIGCGLIIFSLAVYQDVMSSFSDAMRGLLVCLKLISAVIKRACRYLRRAQATDRKNSV